MDTWKRKPTSLEQKHQDRDGGKFASKSESGEERVVKSIRATEETWEAFGESAAKSGITRADLLERLVEDGTIAGDESENDSDSAIDEDTLEEVITLLQDALTLKSNAGGAIKTKIREVLELLGVDLEE